MTDYNGTTSYAFDDRCRLSTATRGMWDSSINQTGSWEFTPYGAPFNFAGPPGVTQLYTGHDYDPVTGHYYAPFRTINPSLSR